MARWDNSLQTAAEVQRLKRDAVLREAGRAFGSRGYHNTSLDDVAKALQVSKGTLYNYVKDKQEILWEFHRLAGEIGRKALEDARNAGGTGADMLRRSLVQYIYGLTQELGACSAIMEIDALRPEDRAKAVKLRDSFETAFLEILRTGFEDGSIRPVDPRLAIFTFMGAINWLPRWYSPKGRLSAAEIAEAMTDLLLGGLFTSQERSSSGTTGHDQAVKGTAVATAPVPKSRTAVAAGSKRPKMRAASR